MNAFRAGSVGLPKAKDEIYGGANGVDVYLQADDKKCVFVVQAGVCMVFTEDPVYHSPTKGVIPFEIVDIIERPRIEHDNE